MLTSLHRRFPFSLSLFLTLYFTVHAKRLHSLSTKQHQQTTFVTVIILTAFSPAWSFLLRAVVGDHGR